MEEKPKFWQRFDFQLGVVVAFVIIIMFITVTISDGNKNLDGFAQCLTEKGTIMYGAFWCEHCENQKEGFGDSFEYINYVECSTPDGMDQLQVCKDRKILGYPTWEFSDGTKISGEMPHRMLADKTGCNLKGGN